MSEVNFTKENLNQIKDVVEGVFSSPNNLEQVKKVVEGVFSSPKSLEQIKEVVVDAISELVPPIVNKAILESEGRMKEYVHDAFAMSNEYIDNSIAAGNDNIIKYVDKTVSEATGEIIEAIGEFSNTTENRFKELMSQFKKEDDRVDATVVVLEQNNLITDVQATFINSKSPFKKQLGLAA